MHFLFEQSELRDIIEKVEKGERLDYSDGVRMMNSQEILALGYMANFVCEQKNGNQTYFSLNRPISFGNSYSSLVKTESPHALMCYRSDDSPAERINQLFQLRAQQDNTKELLSFAPLPFYSEQTSFEGTMGIETTTGIDDLKMLAVSRIVLDNFQHIKGFWVMLGPKLAQVSLAFGVDYLEGTVREEVSPETSKAELNQVMSKQALLQIIEKAGREAVEQRG